MSLRVPAATSRPTQTQETPLPPRSAVLHLERRGPSDPLATQIESLLRQIRTSDFISPEVKAQVEEWAAAIKGRNWNDLGSDQDKMKASRELCFLLIQILQQAFEGVAEEDRARFLAIEEMLLPILRQTVPHSFSAETFIAKYEDGSARQRQTAYKKALLDRQFTRLNQDVDQTVAQIYRMIEAQLESIKQQMGQRATQGANEGRELRGRARELTSQLQQVVEESVTLREAALAAIARLEQAETAHEKCLKQCQSLVDPLL